MSKTVAKSRSKSESGHCQIRNQKVLTDRQLAAVMQRVQTSLPERKAVQELVFLTGQPLSTCQKLLSGNRLPNPESLVALCQSRLVIETVLGLTEGSDDPVVQDVHKAVRRLELERELAQIDAGGRR
jgi:hypothetical protein